MDGQEKSSGFWGTLPGILTGIAAIVTALTGLVVVLSKTGGSDDNSKVRPIPSSTASPPGSAGADAISGTWSGQAVGQDGVAFQIDLRLRKPCELKGFCGSIAVSHIPCHGEVFLEHIVENGYEFLVNNFSGNSDLSKCTAGAGEIFTPQPDQTLLYNATYPPYAKGTLKRVGS